MRFTVVTLFPELFEKFLYTGVIGKAVKNGGIEIKLVNLRDFSEDRGYKRVDDYVYGGGPGMLINPVVLAKSLKSVKKRGSRVVALTPKGRLLNRAIVDQYTECRDIILYCGRYEGYDERFLINHVDDRISIGDYILTGGEIPAMLFIEAVGRKIKGVLGSTESASSESFEDYILEESHYTRPEKYSGDSVPPVLISGHHKKIKNWKRASSLRNTYIFRPELLENLKINKEELKELKQIYKERYCGHHKTD